MDWETLVSEITGGHPEIRLSSMFGMGRVMKEWVHVPAEQSEHWVALVEQAI